MKMHVMSDLHLEHLQSQAFSKFFRQVEKRARLDSVSTLVLAGDIGSLAREVTIAAALRPFMDNYETVLYTPGNHEFFGTSLKEGHDVLLDLCAKTPFANLKVLTPGMHYEHPSGPTFTGGTLWYEDPMDPLMQRGWVDYRFINDDGPGFYEAHDAFKAQRPGDIVVSHHLPTCESIADEWRGAYTNCFFDANMGDTIAEWQEKGASPKLWIHGHTHNHMDYKSILGMRVYCNPFGYPNERANPYFWERILVNHNHEE